MSGFRVHKEKLVEALKDLVYGTLRFESLKEFMVVRFYALFFKKSLSIPGSSHK